MIIYTTIIPEIPKHEKYLFGRKAGILPAFCNEQKRISPRSRTRYPILKVLDLLKETTTNSNSSNVLYTEEAD